MWAGTSWLESWDTILTGCAGESDRAAHTFVPVIVNSESTTDTKALVPLILVATLSSGRMGNLLRWGGIITVEFRFPVHPVKVDRHEAGVWLDVWKLTASHVILNIIIAFKFSCVIKSAAADVGTRSLHILYWVKVIQIDILFLVDIVSLCL